MPSWTIDSPTSLDFDEVIALDVRLFGGSVAVLATDERPSLTVDDIHGRPLRVSHSDGTLTISYEKLTWERLLDFLNPGGDSASVTLTVPAECPIQLGVVSAAALVSGLSSGASVKGVSGDITLDGLAGDVVANTVSGELQARDLDGSVRFGSVSGALTLAESALSSLSAETVSGQVTADVSLDAAGRAKIGTVSGEVALRLPADTDAAVRLSSMSGRVRGDFDGLRSAKAPVSRTVSGSVGAGTGNVSVSTVSGAITLLRRPDRPTTRHEGGSPPEPPRRTAGGPRAETPRAQAGTEGETR